MSIAFYCIGFGEALVASPLLSAQAVPPRLIAAAAVAFLFIFAWMGADWATRFQYGVMAHILRWEGILIDPIGATLAVLVFQFIVAGGVQGGFAAGIIVFGKILDFKESLSVLLISMLFILLAARMDLGAFLTLGWPALAVFGAIQFLARLLSAQVSAIGSKLTMSERHLSLVGIGRLLTLTPNREGSAFFRKRPTTKSGLVSEALIEI